MAIYTFKVDPVHGIEFLDRMILEINKEIGADFTFIGKYEEDNSSVRTLSLCEGDKVIENMFYNIAGTPCKDVLYGNVAIYTKDVQPLFPEDTLLIEMNIIGYIGQPLFSSSGDVIGILVALFKKEISNPVEIEKYFKYMAPRIDMELERAMLFDKLQVANIANEESRIELLKKEQLLYETNIMAKVGAWEIDIINNKVFWSKSTKEIMEVPSDFEPTKEHIINTYKEGKNRDDIIKAANNALEKGVGYDVISQAITAKGNELTLRTIGKAEMQNGKCIRLYGSFQDITEKVIKEKQLKENEHVFKSLFENTPTPIWEEDFSVVKNEIDKLKKSGVVDFEKHFAKNPEKVLSIAKLIKVIRVNTATYKMHHAKSALDLIQNLDKIFVEESIVALTKQLTAIANGETNLEIETITGTLNKEKLTIILKWNVVEGFENTYEKVYLTTTNITAQKLAQTKIVEAEEKFRAFTNQATEGLIVADLEGNFVFVNPAFCKMSGYSQAELLKMAVADIKAANQKETVLSQVKNSKKEITTKAYLKRSDGTTYLTEIKAKNVEIDNEKLVIASIRDITEVVKNEQLLIESEEKFRAFFEDNSAMMFQIDPKKRTIVNCNNSVLEFYGYSKKEFANMPLTTIVDQSLTEIKVTHNTILSQKSNRFETRHKLKNGKIKNVEVFSSAITIGNQAQIVSVVSNISARIKYEKQLKESLLETLDIKNALDQSSNVTISDKNGIITFANDKFCKISEYSRSEIIGKNHRLFNSDYHDTAFFETLWYTINKGNVWKGEMRNKSKTGKIYWSESTIVPTLDINGKPIEFVAISTDISKRKIAEQRVMDYHQHLEEKVTSRTDELRIANKELEQLNFSLSHDLKTPLTTIEGFLEILMEDHEESFNEDMRHIYNVIHRNTLRMEEIIDDLQVFYRMGNTKLELESCNLNDCLPQMLDDIVFAEGYSSDAIELKNLPTVFVDKSLLLQVFVNLITNALKFSANNPNQKVKIGATKNNKGEDVIYVKDNGVGFDENFKENIFEIFQRLHSNEEFGGSGIGLSIVKKIIDKHNGEIWAKSEVGKGATFYFTLPKKEE